MKSSEQSGLFSFIMKVDMCFRSKDGSRLIHSRTFKHLSGHYYLSILKKSKVERVLIFDLVNEKGNIDFVLTDINSGDTKKFDNPATGKYEFNIEKKHSYKIEIISKAAYGKYSVRIKE